MSPRFIALLLFVLTGSAIAQTETTTEAASEQATEAVTEEATQAVEEAAETVAEEAQAATDEAAQATTEAVEETAETVAEEAQAATDEAAQAATEEATQAAEAVEETAETVAEEAQAATDEAAQAVEETAEAVTEQATEATEATEQAAETAVEETQAAAEETTEQTEAAAEEATAETGEETTETAMAADSGVEAKLAACAACHGADGNSVIPQNPKLAGQVPGFIADQLAKFKSGERDNAIMTAQVANLTEEDMLAIDAFYTAQQPQLGAISEDMQEMALVGEKIYRGGEPSMSISACMSCHGPSGDGIPTRFPRVGGQHIEYLEQQLLAYKSGSRASDVMNPIAFRLSEQQIKALAAYMHALK